MKRVDLKPYLFLLFSILPILAMSQKCYVSMGYQRHNNVGYDEQNTPNSENYLFLKGGYRIGKHLILEASFMNIPASSFHYTNQYGFSYGGGSSSHHSYTYIDKVRVRYSYYGGRIGFGYVKEWKSGSEKLNVRVTCMPFVQIDKLGSQQLDEFSTYYRHEYKKYDYDYDNSELHVSDVTYETTYNTPFAYYGARPKIGLFGLHLGNSYAYKSLYIELEGNAGFMLYPRFTMEKPNYADYRQPKLFYQLGISVGYIFGKQKEKEK